MKKVYKRGEIKRVKLMPEEAVLAACLGYTAIGPWQNPVSCYEPAGGYACLSLGGS